MEERKRTERKNINFASYKGKRDRKKYLPVFPVLLVWCLMIWYMFISPLRDLAIQKQALTQKQKELAVLLDENKDYEEMEQAYQQWSGTEEESMGQNRFRMEFWGLLKDEISGHGKVKEIELSGNRCRILLSDWTLEKTVEAMERIEISPLVDHVELTRQNEQTELEVWLAGGEDHEL